MWKSFEFSKLWNKLSLEGPGASYKEMIVYRDNPRQNVGDKL